MVDDVEGVLIAESACPWCGQIVTPKQGPGRPAVWCSQVCRRAAYEERRAAASGVIATRVVTVTRDAPELSWDELVARVLSSPKAVRKVLTGLRAMDANHTLGRSEWVGVRDHAANLGLHLWHRHHRN